MTTRLIIFTLTLLSSVIAFSSENIKNPSVEKVAPFTNLEINLDDISKKLEEKQIIVTRDEQGLYDQVDTLQQESSKAIEKVNDSYFTQGFGLGSCENMCSTSTCNSYCSFDLIQGEPDIRTCQQYYLSYGQGQHIWTTTYGNQICHLDSDIDFWGFEVDIEFFVSDHRVRKCNTSNAHDSKREVAEVSCSFFTGLFNASACEAKVENKFLQLAAQGIFPHPNLLDANGEPQDVCP